LIAARRRYALGMVRSTPGHLLRRIKPIVDN
jgi:hypothetical protein